MKIIIFGATSGIAQAVIRQYANKGALLILVARNKSKLKIVAQDAISHGAVRVIELSSCFNSPDNIIKLFQSLENINLSFDVALLSYGILPDQNKCQKSLSSVCDNVDINFTSVIQLLTELANYFEIRKKGTIAVITSVAGDRGRQSNYYYGACKGGLNIFLQGLRSRLLTFKVNVLVIKPGFVITPMTSSFDKGFLWVNPDVVADDIIKAVDRNRYLIYTPWFWRYIMFIIKFIPEFFFKRISF